MTTSDEVKMTTSDDHLRDLSRLIEKYYEENRASKELVKIAKRFAVKVTNTVEASMKGMLGGRTIMADIFGSLSNGLGTKDSDVDICLRIIGKPQPDTDIITDYLRSIVAPLRSICRKVDTDALSAAVPILKIEYVPPERPKMVLEADITFYNALALHHTELIKSYCNWDPRVAKLGLFLKKTTTRGKPREVREGDYNIYFYRGTNPNHQKLEESQDHTSLAKLFLGFMQYYEDYSFSTQKVAIDRDGRRIPCGNIKRSIIISEPFTSRFSGIKNGQCIERREQVLHCLSVSRRAFQSENLKKRVLAKPENNENTFLKLYEEALFGACPVIKRKKGYTALNSGGKYSVSFMRLTKGQKKEMKRYREEKLKLEMEKLRNGMARTSLFASNYFRGL